MIRPADSPVEFELSIGMLFEAIKLNSKYILHNGKLLKTSLSLFYLSIYLLSLLGNYGNKLDENIPSQISTTSPANPIFDGIAYYYLPWLEYKPCIVVESHWEDVSYRIETQNIFLGIADELVSCYHI